MNTSERLLLCLETYVPPGKTVEETLALFQKFFEFYHPSYGVKVTIAPNQNIAASAPTEASVAQAKVRRKAL